MCQGRCLIHTILQKLREHDGKYTWLSVEANNLGYRLQKEGYGTEYAYAVPFEFEVP